MSGVVPPGWVDIRYRRLPDRVSVFRQRVVHSDAGVVVTLLPAAELEKPVLVEGRAVLEPGAPAVWFTYPGRWHDIGRFHTADGAFTGFYANVLTPVRMDGPRWQTTDLCLDLWMGVDQAPRLLDLEELDEAERRGWTDPATALRAREEAGALLEQARTGAWPPPEVHRWTLARASAPHSNPRDR